MEFLTLKPEAFGLDISDFSLKIIKLKKKGKQFNLASFGEAEIKPGVIEGGEIKEEEKLAETIKEAIKNIKGEKLKTKYVIASLPEEKTFLQVIQMPKMSEEDLKSAIVYEVEDYIPLPLEKVYLDYQIIPPIYDHVDHLDVLIVATPKKIVDSYLSSLKLAGLFPLAFEVESQAIARALIKDEVTTQPVLLVDIGETRTGFIIFSGYSLKLTSTILVSSKNFDELIAKNLKVSLKKAEGLKIKYGLEEKTKLEIKNEKTVIKKEGGKIFEAIIPALVDLSQQIKRYLDYYQTHASHEHLHPNGNRVSKILLCGGGANLKGLINFLSLELKLPVFLGDPWINILPKERKESLPLSPEEGLKYTTAIGLAIRAFKL